MVDCQGTVNDRVVSHLPRCMRLALYITACLLFSYTFYQRVVVSIMTDKLMEDLDVGASGIANLGGAYYFAYASLQLVSVMFVDWFGVVESLTVMALLCAFGSAAFGLATDITVAITGRSLVGGSTAAVFIIILKIASMCFPSRQSLLIGMGVFSGFCGSMLGQAPMASLLEAGVAWRTFVLASVAIPILVTAFFGATWWWLRCTPPQRPRVAVVHVAVLPPQPSNESNPTPNSGNSSTMTSATSPGKPTERPLNAWQRLTVVVCNSNNLALCAVGFFNVAVLNTFASLWGPPFLQAVHGMSRETAAVVSSAVLLGWGLSAPLQGWAGDHISKPVALACASVSGAVAMTLVVYVPGMSPVLLFVLLYVAGMATPIPLMFATVVENNAPAVQGTAAAVVNTCIMLNGAVLQPVVSALLLAGDDAPELGPDGEEVYSAAAYKLGMGVFPVTFACAAVLSLWLIWQRPATSVEPAPPSAKQPPRVLLDVESGYTTDSDNRQTNQ